MVFIDGIKYSCLPCIKGHRQANCVHPERELSEIKKKGRPSSQCGNCKDLRKNKSPHVKCLCPIASSTTPTPPNGPISTSVLPPFTATGNSSAPPSHSILTLLPARKKSLKKTSPDTPHALEHGPCHPRHAEPCARPYPIVVARPRGASTASIVSPQEAVVDHLEALASTSELTTSPTLDEGGALLWPQSFSTESAWAACLENVQISSSGSSNEGGEGSTRHASPFIPDYDSKDVLDFSLPRLAPAYSGSEYDSSDWTTHTPQAETVDNDSGFFSSAPEPLSTQVPYVAEGDSDEDASSPNVILRRKFDHTLTEIYTQFPPTPTPSSSPVPHYELPPFEMPYVDLSALDFALSLSYTSGSTGSTSPSSSTSVSTNGFDLGAPIVEGLDYGQYWIDPTSSSFTTLLAHGESSSSSVQAPPQLLPKLLDEARYSFPIGTIEQPHYEQVNPYLIGSSDVLPKEESGWDV